MFVVGRGRGITGGNHQPATNGEPPSLPPPPSPCLLVESVRAPHDWRFTSTASGAFECVGEESEAILKQASVPSPQLQCAL